MKALVLRNLQKKYSNGKEALKGINLEVEPGDFFGLLGPNGAGKSTIIGIIACLIDKTAGEVSLFGYDLDASPSNAKRQLGLVPQEFNLNMFEKVIDVLTNQAGYYGIPYRLALERAYRYLAQLELLDRAEQQVLHLSGGMRRRLMIARGLIHEPKLFILDEPTAGVDIELRRTTWAFLKEMNAKGTTIILTTHYLEEAESLCRRVAIINHGRIIEDMDVKKLLSTLDRETYILDLQAPLTSLPNIPDFKLSLIDSLTLEVSLFRHHHHSLNFLFEVLKEQGIVVVSLRNKTNRLEELFLDLVQSRGRDE